MDESTRGAEPAAEPAEHATVEASPRGSRWPWFLAALILVLASGIAFVLARAERTDGGGRHLAVGRYEGPTASFDYPDGWHEFYLSIDAQFLAAYGPVEGGTYDYIALLPAPPGSTPENLSTGLEDRVTGSARTIEVNGLAGRAVDLAWTEPDGTKLEGQLILVTGRQANYFVACQSVPEIGAKVSAGCQALLDSFEEIPPSPSLDPSACTDVELAILSLVPMPEGSTVLREPNAFIDETGRACDVMGTVPSSFDGDVLEHFESGLTEAGWHVEEAALDRMSGPKEVWRMIADRDWNLFMVEVYIEDGRQGDFFITTFDG